jgi:hypothetical protein
VNLCVANTHTAVLTDLVRGAKIFVDANSAPDDHKKHLNGFLESLSLATKIHSQHSTLKSLGHPSYQVFILCVSLFVWLLKELLLERELANSVHWNYGRG